MIIKWEVNKKEIVQMVKTLKTMQEIDDLCVGGMFNDSAIDFLKVFPIAAKIEEVDITDFRGSIVWEAWTKFFDKSSPEEIADTLISGTFLGITPDNTIEEIYQMVSVNNRMED